MKQRLLLLGGAVVLLGSVAFGGAFSFESFTDTGISGTTGVVNPTAPTIDLTGSPSSIPANGTHQGIESIEALDTDTSYAFTLVELEVTNEGSTGGSCGTHDYALDNTIDGVGPFQNGFSSLSIGVNGATAVDTGYDLALSIAPQDTDTSCTVSGGIVTATFVVEGDTGIVPD